VNTNNLDHRITTPSVTRSTWVSVLSPLASRDSLNQLPTHATTFLFLMREQNLSMIKLIRKTTCGTLTLSHLNYNHSQTINQWNMISIMRPNINSLSTESQRSMNNFESSKETNEIRLRWFWRCYGSVKGARSSKQSMRNQWKFKNNFSESRYRYLKN
jgi:hypothetical protein